MLPLACFLFHARLSLTHGIPPTQCAKLHGKQQDFPPVTPFPTRSLLTSTEQRLRLLAKMAPCSSPPRAPTWTRHALDIWFKTSRHRLRCARHACLPYFASEEVHKVAHGDRLTSWHLTPKPEAKPLIVLAAEPPDLFVNSLTSAAHLTLFQVGSVINVCANACCKSHSLHLV